MHELTPGFLMIVAIVVIALLLAFKGNRNTGADLRRICRTCGTAHPAFARFCRRCGKKL